MRDAAALMIMKFAEPALLTSISDSPESSSIADEESGEATALATALGGNDDE
jgi:hypothetical protein